jgi:hypothetical protein
MPFLEFFDETLDINSTENYELSVELTHDCLSFFIFDTIRNKFIMLRSSQSEDNKKYSIEELSEMILKDDFLTKKYKKVNILMPSPKFTIIPAQLFDPGKKDEYFTFNHISPDNNIILYNRLPDPDSYLIYSLSKSLHDLARNTWPEVQVQHHLKSLFEHIVRARKSLSGNYIHAHIELDFFSLIFYSANSLKYCNSFNYRSSSDILYYVMNVFKTMDIRQEETLYLSGHTERKNDLFLNLSTYIRNIKYAQPTGNMTFSYVLNESDLYRYINLISAVNCG